MSRRVASARAWNRRSAVTPSTTIELYVSDGDDPRQPLCGSAARVAAAAGAVGRDGVAVGAGRAAEASRPVAREVQDEAVAAVVGTDGQARELVGADHVD